MRILFISPSNTSGGAERVMAILANKLSEKNHSVHYVTFDSGASFYPINEQVDYVRMGLTSKQTGILKLLTIISLEIKRYMKLVAILKKNKPDVVISFLFMANIIGILASKKVKIPILISERNDPTKYSKIKRLIMKCFYKKADGIVCQSNFVKKMADEDYGIKSCVIPNPIDKKQYNPYFIEEKKPKIISIGRLVPQKNHLMTIEAFKKICDKYPNYQLYIYGDGPLKDTLETRIRQLGLNDRVQLAGVESEVMKKNADAMLYIMSSNFEGFPNSLVEAMANGVLSISTDFSSQSARDIITDKVNGFLVEIGNVNRLAKIMDIIFENPNKYIGVAQKGKEIVHKIDIDSVKNQWTNFAKEIITNNK